MVEILLACILFVLLLPFFPLILAGLGAVVGGAFCLLLAGVALWYVVTHLPTVGLAIVSIGATVALGYGIAVGLQFLGRVISARRRQGYVRRRA